MALDVRALQYYNFADVDLKSEGSTDRVVDRDRETYGPLESPQNYESGSHGLPSSSPHPTVQGTPGAGIGRSIGSSPLTIDSAYTENPRSMIQTGSGDSTTRPSPVDRARTGALFMPRRDTADSSSESRD